MDFDYILSQNENELIEYKKQWYWHDESDSKEKNNGIHEFYKDFIALFNTSILTHETKHLIIGFDEKNNKFYDYNIFYAKGDIRYEVTDLNNQNQIKENLLKKINKIHKKYPDNPSNPSLDSLVDVDIIEKNSSQVMILSIRPAPYLLMLDIDLVVGKYPKRSILGRNMSEYGPCVSVLSPEDISSIVDKLKQQDLSNYVKRDTSIRKIVRAYQLGNYPKASVIEPEIAQQLAKRYKFELYVISDKRLNISILFLPKSANQQRTIEYLLEHSAFDNVSQIIVLMESYNQSHSKRIPTLFKFNDFKERRVDVYSLQDFIREEIYSELLNADIFYSGDDLSNNFIIPYSDEHNNETIEKSLKHWYYSTPLPIMVIKGPGGIGKTTAVRYFINTLNHQIKKLFISSHDIAKKIIRQDYKVETLFDFYKIMYDKEDLSNSIDKEILEIAIDSGDVLIVIDGLDEIIAKNHNKFNVENFINSIKSDYCNNIAKAKIIITCRDYFWDRFDSINVTSLSLRSFNEEMAREFFNKSLENPSISRINRAMKLSDSFIDKSNLEKGYIPYILDMVREIFLDKTEHNNDVDDIQKFDSKILLMKTDIDRIIGKACDREILKLENIPIDDQISFFERLSTKYNGVINNHHVKDILKFCLIDSKSSILEKFKGHPLLLADKDKITFRYDFFNDYFRSLAIVNFLRSNDYHHITEEVYGAMEDIIRYKGTLVMDMLNRLILLMNGEKELIEDISLKLNDFNEFQNTNVILQRFNNENFNSMVFTLLLSSPVYNNEHSRTELMCNIYGNGNEISNLSIIDLYSDSHKVTFDFSDKLFRNCYFDGYADFTKCKFNSKTYFSDSSFKSVLGSGDNLHNSGIINISNFDVDSCEMGALFQIFDNINQRTTEAHANLKRNILQIIQYFWKYSEFRKVKREALFKDFPKHTTLIEQLIKLNVLKLIKATTHQKRNDSYYIITGEYTNLRKVMEENSTCFELDKIVKLIN